MWIALGIVGGLLLLIGLLLSLPIDLMIRDDEEGQPSFRVRVLFLTFGGKPAASDKSNPIVDFILDITGLSRAKGTSIRSNVKSSGVRGTVADTVRVVWSVLEQIVRMIPKCKLKRLKFTMVCTAEDADAAALHYGTCCAIVYPLLAWIHTVLPIDERREEVDVRADFMAPHDEIHYDVVLRMWVWYILKAFVKITWKEALRSKSNLISAQTHATRRKKRRRKKAMKHS